MTLQDFAAILYGYRIHLSYNEMGRVTNYLLGSQTAAAYDRLSEYERFAVDTLIKDGSW